MPSLADLQERFAHYLASGRTAPLARTIPPECLDRLTIHRNNSLHAGEAALRAQYPVIARLVGDTFLAAMARRYVAELPPGSPVLATFGVHFPAWLPRQPEVRNMPWLEDIARLEWALQEAYHAADAATLDPGALGDGGVTRLAESAVPLHPSVRLLASSWPVGRIWTVNQAGWTGDVTVSLDEGGDRLVVHRTPDLHTRWQRLGAGRWTLLRTLAEGEPLGAACEAALAAETDLALGPVLTDLIRSGVLCAPATSTTERE